MRKNIRIYNGEPQLNYKEKLIQIKKKKKKKRKIQKKKKRIYINYYGNIRKK